MDSTSARRPSGSRYFPLHSLKYFRGSQVHFHDSLKPVRSKGERFHLRRNVRHHHRPSVHHRRLRRAAQTQPQPQAPASKRRTPIRRKALLVKSSWRYSLQARQLAVPPLAADHPTAIKLILHLTTPPRSSRLHSPPKVTIPSTTRNPFPHWWGSQFWLRHVILATLASRAHVRPNRHATAWHRLSCLCACQFHWRAG
jgi:hypothetical protein